MKKHLREEDLVSEEGEEIAGRTTSENEVADNKGGRSEQREMKT